MRQRRPQQHVEEDDESQLKEMDALNTKKTLSRRPIKQKITYETYPRKMRALRDKMQTFEELFKSTTRAR